MFATFKQIFSRKNKDLQKRILFTFGCLLIFKLGTAITVPGIDKAALGLNSLGFLDLINVMGGGALENFSIFALGVLPYINASIVMQLLEMDIVPYFSDLAKQGGTGRAKLNEITRYFGIALAFIQGFVYSFTYLGKGSIGSYLEFALILTAGTCLLLWLGDQMTKKGIGNGISIIIMAGIISSMPCMFISAFSSLMDGSVKGIILFIIYILIYLAIIIGIVFFQVAERRIPIQYANRSASSLGAQNYVPFKLNSSGVIPVIFVSALISIPAIIAQVTKNEAWKKFVENYFSITKRLGFAIYMICVIGFSFFYMFLQLKPKEIAENLQKNRGYIPAVRPGKDTEEYINKVLLRITFVGSLALAFLAALPVVFSMVAKDLPSSVSIGGTGLLIVVGVALETWKQLEGELSMRTYKKSRRN